ncbi:MAG: glycosyltransferase family 2 protein [Thermoanaerobaculia bacterium]|nr:glycosyltransferase family 2 protein [Thermoanaerobaculia bacterium]
MAVVIVNWNGLADTLEVLDELDKLEGPKLHRVVVDNGSTDDSAAVLRRREDVHLVETGENLGFAGGNVAGIRWAAQHLAFDWVLLLNNDVALDPNLLPPLLAACRDPAVGAAGPKIYYHEQPDVIWAAGGRLRLRETVTGELGKGRRDDPRFDEARDVSYLTTCCILIPRDALERVGLLDPLFFIGVEDADWCRRALDAGYRIRYEPASRLWHKVAVSTGGGYTPFKTFHTGRSNTLYVRRHHGVAGLAVYLLWVGLAFLAALVRELPRGNAKAVLAKLRGVGAGLRAPIPEPPRL